MPSLPVYVSRLSYRSTVDPPPHAEYATFVPDHYGNKKFEYVFNYYCDDAGNNKGEVFRYPAGGSPIAALTRNFDFPLGVTAAQK